MGSRAAVLAVLHGQRVKRLPVFSGLPALTAAGLVAAGVRYQDAHGDAGCMARAAASTFQLFGFESAVVPFDLCVEAEALGAAVDFHTDVNVFLPPVISQPRRMSERLHEEVELLRELAGSERVDGMGRIGVVGTALQQLKSSFGREVAIGAWVPGPFTLAWQLYGADAWFACVAAGQGGQGQALLRSLADFLARVAIYYLERGADFITVHEMGGSPQAIGPATFRAFVKPALAYLFKQLPPPNVLSICGDTNAIVEDMAACGADALNVDQRNDLARTRRVLGERIVLLGNLDPVNVLGSGTPALIRESVRAVASARANAIWPGCDLCVETPEANMRALMDEARELM